MATTKESEMTKPETKTDIPKTDIPRAKLDLPFDLWAQAARENLMRLQATINAYWDELASYENAMYDRARSATADLANLAQESIQYVATLSAEWRRMTLEATRRVTDSFRS
jgi:hypothetical protein